MEVNQKLNYLYSMSTKIPIYDAKIIGTDNTGIFAMSFVDIPAIESNFVALKTSTPVKLALDKKKQILTGPVLIPGKLIYRNDEKLGEYYLRFTAPDIEKILHKMMKVGVALSSTTHQHEKPLKGNYLTEVWTVTDPKRDKSVALGLGEFPKDTLMASYKIEDATYWRTKVMTGDVKGFSLEGIFNFNSVKMSKPKLTTTAAAKALGKKPNAVSAFLMSVAAMLEGDTAAATDDLADEAKKDEVDAGEPYLIFELADGSEIYVDSEGFATLDGEQAPAGEHALKDGNFIVIDDAGTMVVTQPEADGAEAAKADAALVAAAKERTKQYLAKMSGKAPAKADPKTAKIAALKAQIAELEKTPSTGKAKPGIVTTTVALKDRPIEELTSTEKMARILALQRESQSGKK